MSDARNMVEAFERLVDGKIAKAMRGGSSTVPAEYMGEDSEGKAWVVLAGSSSMTPVRRSSVEASVGDTVSVTVADGMAVIDANLSDKSAGMKSVAAAKETAVEAIDYASQANAAASSAQVSANSALRNADIAQASADSAVADAARANEAAVQAISDAADAADAASSAQSSANSARTSADKANYALADMEKVVGTVNWIAEHGEYALTEDTAVDDSKVYYTRSGSGTDADPYVYTRVANPIDSAISTYYELVDVDESIQNFINAHVWLAQDGLYVGTQGTDYKARIDADSLDILDDTGAVVATFGETAQIGKTGESHMELDYHSLKMMDKEGNEYLHISDLRGADGTFELTENFAANYADYVIALVPSEVISVMVDDVSVGYTLTIYEDIGYARIRLDNPAYPQSGSIVSVRYKTTSGNAKAYTLGTRKANTNIGAMSYAEGKNVESSGYISHAEGMNTVASDHCSHAEGDGTKATSLYCHAEGSETIASDWASHAEGMHTVASGVASHAGGSFTVAAGLDQTAIGRCNVEDSNSTYALIIGNGTVSTPANALTVAWNGNVGMGQILTIHSLPSSSAKIDTSTNNGATSSAVIFGRTEIMDKNGTWVSTYGSNTQTNGQTRSYIGCNNMKTDGTMVTNYLNIGVNKDGSRYYAMTDPAAFRRALGFGDGTWETQDDTGPAVSVANSSWAKLTQVTLTAGHWLVLVGGYAASNSTGRRGFHLSSASSVTAGRLLTTLMAPPSGTALYTVIPYLVNPTARTTYNIFGFQNSGGNLNMSAIVRAVHLYTA